MSECPLCHVRHPDGTAHLPSQYLVPAMEHLLRHLRRLEGTVDERAVALKALILLGQYAKAARDNARDYLAEKVGREHILLWLGRVKTGNPPPPLPDVREMECGFDPAWDGVSDASDQRR